MPDDALGALYSDAAISLDVEELDALDRVLIQRQRPRRTPARSARPDQPVECGTTSYRTQNQIEQEGCAQPLHAYGCS